jgi:N-acetylneuraminate lyase
VKTEFRGLIPAVHTPLHADGRVNPDAIAPYVEYLLQAGVSGLFVCGSTGEFPSLTVEERHRVAEAFVLAAHGRVPMIIHVGHYCMQEARLLASHAAQIGATAIGACPPSYFKPADVDALIEWCMEIAEEAPQTPFFYYHIPAVSGVSLPMVEFLEHSVDRFPSLAGVKYTSPLLDEFMDCVASCGTRYTMMYGRDQMLLGALASGAEAAIGTTYNHAAPLYLALWRAFESGDMTTARLHQHRSVQFIRVLMRYGGVRASKALMRFIGIECGPARPPFMPFSREEEKSLRSDLDSIGFFDWRDG